MVVGHEVGPLKHALESLLLPPGGLFVLVALGLLLRGLGKNPWIRRTGTAFASAGALGTVALSTPYVAWWLLGSLQTSPAIPPDATSIEADVIVVLSADVDCDPPEFGPDQPGPLSLLRCRYGAALARRTGLPLVITGGVLRPDRRPVSHVLRDFVVDELSVPVAWTEDASLSTRQNARFTAEGLRQRGLVRVALVTHAWHMPRALEAFEREGVEVLPAPTAPATGPHRFWHGALPSAKALRDSCWALHERVGRVWYRLSD